MPREVKKMRSLLVEECEVHPYENDGSWGIERSILCCHTCSSVLPGVDGGLQCLCEILHSTVIAQIS